jgi:hypothetical protein
MNLFLVSGGLGGGVNDLRRGDCVRYGVRGLAIIWCGSLEEGGSQYYITIWHWDGCMMTCTLYSAFGENLIPCFIVTSKNYMLPGSDLLLKPKMGLYKSSFPSKTRSKTLALAATNPKKLILGSKTLLLYSG